MELLCFLDCEMSGLDSTTDVITEIGIVVAKADDLTVLGEFSRVVHFSDHFLDTRLSDWCKRVHQHNGLIQDIRTAPPSQTIQQIEKDALLFMQQFCPDQIVWRSSSTLAVEEHNPHHRVTAIYLCGNNVLHDRKFIQRQMPELAKLFHPTEIEMNVLLKLCSVWNPALKNECPKKTTPQHRSLSDARSSYNLARFFRERLFVPVSFMPFSASTYPPYRSPNNRHHHQRNNQMWRASHY